MSLLGFITGVGSIIGGLSSGKSKSSTSTSGTSTDVSTGLSNINGTLTTVGTQTGSQTQTGSEKQTGTTTTKGSSTSQVSGSDSQNVTSGSTTTNYSSDVLASLDSLLKSQLAGGSMQESGDALKGRLDQIMQIAGQPEFDVNQYVSGIAAQATAATQNDLDSRINTILSASGGSETGNSMNALLGNRLRNDAAANLSGIISGAAAQGQQIKQQQQESITGQITNLAAGLGQNITSLLGASAGAQQSTTGNQNTTGTSTQTGSETTSQQQIMDLLNTLSNTINTTQTENTTATQNQQTTEASTSTKTANQNSKTKSNDYGKIFDSLSGLFKGSQLAA